MVSQTKLKECFPYSEFPAMREVQDEALMAISKAPNGVILEIPTGEGKTAIGITALKAMALVEKGPLFYVTPTKSQVEQVVKAFPHDTLAIYGRSDYSCLYYRDHGVNDVTAEASPCYLLNCPHRIDEQTGEPTKDGVEPCPYHRAKFDALKASEKGKIIVSTTAFYVTNRFMVGNWRALNPALVVVDEVHRLAKTTRGLFEYSVTDYGLEKAKAALAKLNKGEARKLGQFIMLFKSIARERPSSSPSLLKEEEIEVMLDSMEKLDGGKIESTTRQAIADGKLDAVADAEEIKILEHISRNIPRFVSSLKRATVGEGHRPLTYVVAFYYSEDDPKLSPRHKATHFLTIKSYYVLPIIRKVLGARVIAYSATIGNSEILSWETGLNLPFQSFGSTFVAANAKIFMPRDTFDLSKKKMRRDDMKNSLKLIVKSAKEFAERGLRSLVVVTSDEERQNFLTHAERMGLNAISYGNGVLAKDAVQSFKAGEGDVLVGTAAHYGEGIDLPKKIAPVIFFLRPGYQRPDAPETQFEERRFSQGHCWALWNWRVMIEALQVRGRNIRTEDDMGVCIFISQQFKRFLYSSLPEWLRPSYDSQSTMQEVVEKTIEFLTSSVED